MPRVIIDTNHIVSYLISPLSELAQAVDNIIENHILLLSPEIYEEYLSVLKRSKFVRYVNEEKVRSFLQVTLRKAENLIPVTKINDCSDPKDNKFLELALDGKADFIITGDSDLKDLNPYQNIKIVSAKEFLAF